MKHIRIGKEITVRWAVLTNGEPLPLAGRDLRLLLRTPRGGQIETPFMCEDNLLHFVFRASQQHHIGRYGLTLYENFGRDAQSVVDCCDAFSLVATTCEERGTDTGLTAATVELQAGSLEVGIRGESAYEIYRRRHPESALTEEQYAALPVEAAAAVSTAVAEATAATRQAAEATRASEKQTAQAKEAAAAASAAGAEAAEAARQAAAAVERMQAASEEAIRQVRRVAAARYEAAGIRYNEATGFYELNGLTDITDEQAEVIYAAGPLRDGIKYQYSGNNFSPLPSNPRTNLCYRDWKNSVDLTEKFRGNAAIEVALLESSRARMDTGANSPYYVVLSSASGRLSYCFDACKSLRRVIGILDCSRLANGTDGWGCPVLEEVYLWGLAGNSDLRGAPRLLPACVHYMIRYALPAKAITISLHPDVYDAAMADPQVQAALEAQPMVALASA